MLLHPALDISSMDYSEVMAFMFLKKRIMGLGKGLGF
jgi:hypothetical protein